MADFGLVTEFNDNFLQVWIRGQARLSAPLSQLRMECQPRVGHLVCITEIDEKHYRISSHSDNLIPQLEVNERCIMVGLDCGIVFDCLKSHFSAYKIILCIERI